MSRGSVTVAKENVFTPLVNNLAQGLKKRVRTQGVLAILNDIEGAERLNTSLVMRRNEIHMSQLEVGYYYILNSGAEWINVILPLRKKNNQLSYLRATIIKTPDYGLGRIVQSEEISNEKITKDSYWSPILLALKIPISIPMFKFINWPSENPLEVKE